MTSLIQSIFIVNYPSRFLHLTHRKIAISKNCPKLAVKKKLQKIVLFFFKKLQKIKQFSAIFLKKKASFGQLFDIQMAIFQRVSLAHKVNKHMNQLAISATLEWRNVDNSSDIFPVHPVWFASSPCVLSLMKNPFLQICQGIQTHGLHPRNRNPGY